MCNAAAAFRWSSLQLALCFPASSHDGRALHALANLQAEAVAQHVADVVMPPDEHIAPVDVRQPTM